MVRGFVVRGRRLALGTLVAVLSVAGGSAAASPQVTVQNGPTATCSVDSSGFRVVYACGSNISAAAGTSFSGSVATFQISPDGQAAGVSVNSATIQWGDGTSTSDGTISGDSTGGAINGAHTYASPGLYTVTIDASGCTSDNSQCGTVDVNGTASVDAVGSTNPHQISVNMAPDSMADGNYTITARALDRSGKLLTGYNDAAPTWSDSGSELGSQTPAAFVDGVSTTTGVALSSPTHRDRVLVSSGGVTGQSAPFNIIGPVTKLAITSLAGPETAGQSFPVTVRAEDAAGNTVTSYAGSPSWSDTTGQLTSGPAAFSQGVSANQVTLADPATSDRITIVDSAQGLTSQSSTFKIIGPVRRLAISVAGPGRAGQPFPVTVRAKDAVGNTVTSYAGSPSWSDTSGQLTGAPAAFIKGVSTNQVTFAEPATGDQITIVDSAQGVTSHSSAFKVLGRTTCNWDSTGNEVVYQCGTDLSATADTSFSGQVASFQISGAGQELGVSLNSATINWGDGTPASDGTISGDSTGGAISGAHTYASPGIYTVTVDSSGCTSDNSHCGTVDSTATAVVNSP